MNKDKKINSFFNPKKALQNDRGKEPIVKQTQVKPILKKQTSLYNDKPKTDSVSKYSVNIKKPMAKPSHHQSGGGGRASAKTARSRFMDDAAQDDDDDDDDEDYNGEDEDDDDDFIARDDEDDDDDEEDEDDDEDE